MSWLTLPLDFGSNANYTQYDAKAKWIILNFKLPPQIIWREFRLKEGDTNLSNFFNCDENVETNKSFWEIHVLFTCFGLAAAQAVLNLEVCMPQQLIDN